MSSRLKAGLLKTAMTMRRNHYLYLVAFTSGCVTLSLELSASRLLAPAFGTTEIIWSAIIGLILLYLSVGYLAGGRWADQSPEPGTLYTILCVAGCAIALIPPLSHPVLNLAVKGMRAWNLGFIAGPFLLILALFAIPVTLLATISPFIIRLSVHNVQRSGGTAGMVYALSTAGSFLGAFLPNLLLIPNLGTWRTFVVLAIVCLVTGLGGLWLVKRRRFWIFCLLLLAVIFLLIYRPDVTKTQKGLIYESESTYNFIQVIEDSGQRRYLLLNEGQGIHSIYTPPNLIEENPLAILTDGPWDYFLIAPFFNTPPFPLSNVQSMLVIGLAAGTTVTEFTEFYGTLPVDGVEIDPEIVSVAKTFFDMKQPNLAVHIADGRTYLATTDRQYSLIVIDAYRLPYIPWHLTTVEFFRQVRNHLDTTGAVAINVGHTTSDWQLVDAMVATLETVFPSVHIINIEGSLNAVVVATPQITIPDNLVENLPSISDSRLQLIAQRAAANLRKPEPGALIFTDDRAPVEQLSHEVALSYILGE
jgi:predicted membrane-bound spermidine synthase